MPKLTEGWRRELLANSTRYSCTGYTVEKKGKQWFWAPIEEPRVRGIRMGFRTAAEAMDYVDHRLL
jgi:hypothetical protein